MSSQRAKEKIPEMVLQNMKQRRHLIDLQLSDEQIPQVTKRSLNAFAIIGLNCEIDSGMSFTPDSFFEAVNAINELRLWGQDRLNYDSELRKYLTSFPEVSAEDAQLFTDKFIEEGAMNDPA